MPHVPELRTRYRTAWGEIRRGQLSDMDADDLAQDAALAALEAGEVLPEFAEMEATAAVHRIAKRSRKRLDRPAGGEETYFDPAEGDSNREHWINKLAELGERLDPLIKQVPQREWLAVQWFYGLEGRAPLKKGRLARKLSRSLQCAVTVAEAESWVTAAIERMQALVRGEEPRGVYRPREKGSESLPLCDRAVEQQLSRVLPGLEAA